MRIEKVIFTIDDNPHYRGFWISISKHYKERLKIHPKLFVIGENVDISKYETEYGSVEIIEKIPNIPSIIQALIGKFYFTISEPETVWKIGDLDLYPLQKSHFEKTLLNIDDDKYVHLNPHAYGVNWRDTIYGLAGYYHVAKGRVFEKELYFKDKSFKDVCEEIYYSDKFGIKFHNIGSNSENHMASKDWGWFCCEEMYTGNLLKSSKNLIEIPPIEYNRIDRSDMKFELNKIKKEFYIDFHSPRPYEEHSYVIEKILENVCTQ
jgi:hypothetical protein